MPPMPPIRRVVTGHNDKAKAIVVSDEVLKPFDPFTAEMSEPEEGRAGFINICRTAEYPAKNDHPWKEVNATAMDLADEVGTTIRIVDIPSGSPALMHRTISFDTGIVLDGEVVMVLDDGVETVCKKHDIIVQRGTIHAWKNVGKETVRMFFMLTPSEKLKIGGEVLEATMIDPSTLYDEKEGTKL